MPLDYKMLGLAKSNVHMFVSATQVLLMAGFINLIWQSDGFLCEIVNPKASFISLLPHMHVVAHMRYIIQWYCTTSPRGHDMKMDWICLDVFKWYYTQSLIKLHAITMLWIAWSMTLAFFWLPNPVIQVHKSASFNISCLWQIVQYSLLCSVPVSCHLTTQRNQVINILFQQKSCPI